MISGGIKYFDKSKTLFADGSTMTATTGEASTPFALDRNPLTFYQSVGSDDTTTETLVLTMPESTTIDRFFALICNWKEFTVKYDSGGGVFVDFNSVIGLDGALGGGITETAFADDTAYYEFASVTTSAIQITITETQVVDEEKKVSQLIGTKELGTFLGFPIIKQVVHSRNTRKKKALSGKMVVQKSIDTVGKIKIDLKKYPAGDNFSADIDLVFTLFDREDSFLVWLCGGRRGSDYFKYTLRGFRLRDVITMQVLKDYKVRYEKNVYTLPISVSVELVETT